MYALILIGYTIWAGSGPPGIMSRPTMMQIGTFSSLDECQNALASFDKTKNWKDVTANMSEYRLGLLCSPAPQK
jgi:hypothetical protein